MLYNHSYLYIGGVCSGNGYCMNIASIYAMYGYTYGAEADTVTYAIPISTTSSYSGVITTPPVTWDAHIWFECVCSNNVAWRDYSVLGNIKYPTVGTRYVNLMCV